MPRHPIAASPLSHTHDPMRSLTLLLLPLALAACGTRGPLELPPGPPPKPLFGGGSSSNAPAKQAPKTPSDNSNKPGDKAAGQ
ncbi:MAG: hypothetical protein KGL40_03545 [Rhodocyclaceae bacterium]|nr:hypothetical protein [Rhodocyclaceae bacterium]